MILAEIIAISLLASLLTGGSLKALSQEPLRGEWMLLVLLPAQLLWPHIAAGIGLTCSWSLVVWLLMMSALFGVLLLNSSHWPALVIAALGIACNVLVIGLNQGMPVSMSAASEVGEARREVRAALERDCLHKELDGSTLLPVLADEIPIPGPSWQRGVLSIGDLLLAGGLGGWIFLASRRREVD